MAGCERDAKLFISDIEFCISLRFCLNFNPCISDFDIDDDDDEDDVTWCKRCEDDVLATRDVVVLDFVDDVLLFSTCIKK